ncbi:MAG: ABC transporter ATP-binding protein [Nocardiopsaceae bacterium]|nr:ABC transporter ATP-binding protein [Nocardiopsaceae bacterium]
MRRSLSYLKPYRLHVCLLVFWTVVDSVITVTVPLLLKVIIDNGIMHHDFHVIAAVAGIAAGLAALDLIAQVGQTFASARIGQGVSYDMRTSVFRHIRRQPMAFFTRAQTGSLVSRLNTDVVGAQQAMTTVLTTVVSSSLTLVLVLAEMFYLSWLISVISLVVFPMVILPARALGRRIQRYAREQMQQNAEMGALMNERFNTGGAMLSKLYGRRAEEDEVFARRAGQVRDIGVRLNVFNRALFIIMTFIASLVTAMVYGVGGSLVASHVFELGTLVAMAALLGRLYAPINQMAQMQGNVVQSMVSFDRLFEVLKLKPLIEEKASAVALSAKDGAPGVEFDSVTFRYPVASEVSLASLESTALPETERDDVTEDVIKDVSFEIPPGTITALVGPSGAGKTTLTHLVARLYDPRSGTVRIGGHDLRDVSLDSLYEIVGVVTQDAYLYHDTIRMNLAYARPGTTEEEMREACQAAQIWDVIQSLPSGLDTVVGDRGYRLSGGEKQRIAVARLLLKRPSVVVLDEATAHLDSESEAAIQRAFKTALAGRTSLVIAHRLSTVLEADQILVIDGGRVRERGKHEELLAVGGLYAELYRTQFLRQRAEGNGNGAHGADRDGADRAVASQSGSLA